MSERLLKLMPAVEAHLIETMVVSRLLGPRGINPSKGATTGLAGESVPFYQRDLSAGFSEVIADGATDDPAANHHNPLRGSAETRLFRVDNQSAAASFRAVRLSINCRPARVTILPPPLIDNGLAEQCSVAGCCQPSDSMQAANGNECAFAPCILTATLVLTRGQAESVTDRARGPVGDTKIVTESERTIQKRSLLSRSSVAERG